MCRLVTCINGGLCRSAGEVCRCHCASGPSDEAIPRMPSSEAAWRLVCVACPIASWLAWSRSGDIPLAMEQRKRGECASEKAMRTRGGAMGTGHSRTANTGGGPAVAEHLMIYGRSMNRGLTGSRSLPERANRVDWRTPPVWISFPRCVLRAAPRAGGAWRGPLVWLMQHAAARLPQKPRQRRPGVSCPPRPRLSHVLTVSSQNSLFLRLRLRPILFSSSPLPRATRPLAPV
jgi:hypothetical protein